jgi:acetoacetyl-CoA synthetase
MLAVPVFQVGAPVRGVQSARSKTPTAEGLKLIWEQVFQKSPISLTDNFHALGGNAREADAICDEIERIYGQHLSGVTISHVPTVAELAAFLQQDPPPRLSPFIQIKTGSAPPPIFFAHGLSGMVEYYTLAQHIRTDHPIYGVQARGLDGIDEPFDRVEDMASFYLDGFARIHPNGPYYLIGYSFGGLVAFEMAQRLVAQGKKVGMLALVDAYPHPRFMPPNPRLRLFGRRMKTHARNMNALSMSSALSYFGRGLRRKFRIAVPAENGSNPAVPEGSLAATMPRVNQKAYRAFSNYRPRHYPGLVQFVTTKIQTFFPGDPAAVWRRLSADLVVETIPGDHLNILSTEYRPLADALSRFMARSDADLRI